MEKGKALTVAQVREIRPAPDRSLSMNGRTFVPVILGKADGELLKFSDREVRFLDRFLATMNLDMACEEIGIAESTGRNYLKRPHIRKYLEEKLRIAALEAGTDIREHVAWLRNVRDGVDKPTGTQLEAAKIISRHLRPSGPGVVINNNQLNVQGGVASPYAGMTSEQLLAGMKERSAEAGGLEDAP